MDPLCFLTSSRKQSYISVTIFSPGKSDFYTSKCCQRCFATIQLYYSHADKERSKTSSGNKISAKIKIANETKHLQIEKYNLYSCIY